MNVAVVPRRDLYRRLAARNRRVARLRVLVPVAGVIILATLIGQIYLSSLSSRFGISQVKLSPDSIIIDKPDYAGILGDGSHYRVTSQSARAPANRSDLIDLVQATLSIDRASGTRMDARAPFAQLDTSNQLVIIDGIASALESTGTLSKFYRSVFDWSAQTLTSQGPVAIDYADGATLVADTMLYDSKTAVWTFTNVTVTLPSTPGADAR